MDPAGNIQVEPGDHLPGIPEQPWAHCEFFASIDNLFNRKYSTWGILSDPTGIGAPGIPVTGYTNGPGIDNRFLSPAAPLEIFGGVRITF